MIVDVLLVAARFQRTPRQAGSVARWAPHTVPACWEKGTAAAASET